MNIERDKFLCEAMGYRCDYWQREDLQEWIKVDANWRSRKGQPATCYFTTVYDGVEVNGHVITDFSTWDGFGKLWPWLLSQSFDYDILYIDNGNWEPPTFREELVNPDALADAVYSYLKEK